jgi:hypothetical protein
MKNGLTSKDMRDFTDLLVVANDEQLQLMIRETKGEINRRFGRKWAEADDEEE